MARQARVAWCACQSPSLVYLLRWLTSTYQAQKGQGRLHERYKGRKLVVGGDFNGVLDKYDIIPESSRGKRRIKQHKAVIALFASYGASEVWRRVMGLVRHATHIYYSSNGYGGSRLDTFVRHGGPRCRSLTWSMCLGIQVLQDMALCSLLTAFCRPYCIILTSICPLSQDEKLAMAGRQLTQFCQGPIRGSPLSLNR